MTPLCGARSALNMALTCGKSAGHLATDPWHQFQPGVRDTHMWLDDYSMTPSPSADPRLQAAAASTPGRASHGRAIPRVSGREHGAGGAS